MKSAAFLLAILAPSGVLAQTGQGQDGASTTTPSPDPVEEPGTNALAAGTLPGRVDRLCVSRSATPQGCGNLENQR